MIKNIVFDYGRVLVDYDFKSFLASIIEDEKQRDEFLSLFCSAEFCDRCDRGFETYSDIITEARREYPHWDKYLTEFEDRHIDAMVGEVPGMRAVLQQLKEKGYMLYGLTNWSATVYPVIEKYDILKMMDGRVISSEEHVIKPEAEIYHRLCEKYSLKEDECLFTDDKQINVDGAIAAGMKAVLFNDAEQFLGELRSLKLL